MTAYRAQHAHYGSAGCAIGSANAQTASNRAAGRTLAGESGAGRMRVPACRPTLMTGSRRRDEHRRGYASRRRCHGSWGGGSAERRGREEHGNSAYLGEVVARFGCVARPCLSCPVVTAAAETAGVRVSGGEGAMRLYVPRRGMALASVVSVPCCAGRACNGGMGGGGHHHRRWWCSGAAWG